ncbi:hypothetical protein [Pseudofrankia asymbiotica]|uniref:Uncharacterized protein n=1 Tax=Pseudofrankia asymbiotica TaxID=1834516 RepID=A0A1V2IAX5_9ACTN|nr:hypothetical protein [Pseudofrankia asymbiotica]ONH30362.1 hypothetical protein BL253_14660 [Pseudofrankia asymbiotica]
MTTRDEGARQSRDDGIRRTARATTGLFAISAAAVIGFGVLARDHSVASAGTGGGGTDDDSTTGGTQDGGLSSGSDDSTWPFADGSGDGLVSGGSGGAGGFHGSSGGS